MRILISFFSKKTKKVKVITNTFAIIKTAVLAARGIVNKKSIRVDWAKLLNTILVKRFSTPKYFNIKPKIDHIMKKIKIRGKPCSYFPKNMFTANKTVTTIIITTTSFGLLFLLSNQLTPVLYVCRSFFFTFFIMNSKTEGSKNPSSIQKRTKRAIPRRQSVSIKSRTLAPGDDSLLNDKPANAKIPLTKKRFLL